MSELIKPTEPREKPEEKAASTDPPAVTRGEFDLLRQTLDSVTASLQALASARSEPYPTTQQPAAEPMPTIEEITADLQENKPGKLMKFVDMQISKVRKDEVEPLRNQGALSLASIARQTAINSGGMPYLDKIKKEVDVAFEKLPLHQRTTPEAYNAVYQFIAGSRLGDIVKEETEKAIRQGRENQPEPQPATAPGRAATTTPEGKTAMAQVFNEQALGALKEQGKTPDEFARKMGYKSAEEYALFAVKQGEANA